MLETFSVGFIVVIKVLVSLVIFIIIGAVGFYISFGENDQVFNWTLKSYFNMFLAVILGWIPILIFIGICYLVGLLVS